MDDHEQQEDQLPSNAITQICADGVLGEFDYNITFSPDEPDARLRLVYAENGRGKTNLLRGTSLLLNPSPEAIEELFEIAIADLSIKFSDGSIIRMKRDDVFGGDIELSVILATLPNEPNIDALFPTHNPITSHSIKISSSEFTGRMYRRALLDRPDFSRFMEIASRITPKAVYIGDNRMAITSEDSDRGRDAIPTSGRRRYGPGSVTRLLERAEQTLSRSAFAGLATGNVGTGVYVEITNRTLQGASGIKTQQAARKALLEAIDNLLTTARKHEEYGLLSLRQVSDIKKILDEVRQNDKSLRTLYSILNPYLENLQNQADTLDPALELIDRFVTGTNRFLDRKRVSFSTRSGISLIGKDGNPLNPEALSSGEKHLLYLMSQAVVATADEAVLIIDEPEISLGLDWQRMLLDELMRCTEGSANQFLIASHSLQIMGGMSRSCIVTPTSHQQDS